MYLVIFINKNYESSYRAKRQKSHIEDIHTYEYTHSYIHTYMYIHIENLTYNARRTFNYQLGTGRPQQQTRSSATAEKQRVSCPHEGGLGPPAHSSYWC